MPEIHLRFLQEQDYTRNASGIHLGISKIIHQEALLELLSQLLMISQLILFEKFQQEFLKKIVGISEGILARISGDVARKNPKREITNKIPIGTFGGITGSICKEFLGETSGAVSARISREIPSLICRGVPRGFFFLGFLQKFLFAFFCAFLQEFLQDLLYEKKTLDYPAHRNFNTSSFCDFYVIFYETFLYTIHFMFVQVVPLRIYPRNLLGLPLDILIGIHWIIILDTLIGIHWIIIDRIHPATTTVTCLLYLLSEFLLRIFQESPRDCLRNVSSFSYWKSLSRRVTVCDRCIPFPSSELQSSKTTISPFSPEQVS